MTAATTTEAAPYSVEEMRDFLDRVSRRLLPTRFEEARAVATAAALEATKTALERAKAWADENIRDAYARKAPTSVDPVERPAHYTQGDVECIDAIKAQLSPDEYRGFLRGQVAKYNWRVGRKDSAYQDARKAHWYLTRLVIELEPEGGK